MGTAKTTIDINGKRYDAVSGAMIGDSSAPAHHQTPHRGVSVDGFIRTPHAAAAMPLAPIPASARPKPRYVPGPAHVIQKSAQQSTSHIQEIKHKPHQPAAALKPHTPQKAHTLMRTAVKKPVIKSPQQIKAHPRTDLVAAFPVAAVAPKTGYTSINPVRQQRAVRLVKNPAVAHFVQPKSVVQQPMSPVSYPAPKAVQPAKSVTVTSHPSVSTHAPLASHRRAIEPPVQPRFHAAKPAATAPRPAPLANPKPSQDDIFRQALADARSHEEVFTVRESRFSKMRRLFAIFGGGLSIIAITAFAVYHTKPNLNLTLASYKAGVHAKLPADSVGYNFQHLSYASGNVTAEYGSTASNQQFSVKQKSSSWDSQALLDNYVKATRKEYRIYQRAGRTIYIVDNHQATWVDSGVWYTIDGTANLSTAQLLDVAASL